MEERGYKFKYRFMETTAFRKDYGRISESERQRLHFDLMLGRGEIIEDTGCLKKVRCGIAGDDGKEGWEVVFADFTYPDIGVKLYLLLLKYPLRKKRYLSSEMRNELRKLKEKVDYFIGCYYEKLRNND